MSKIENRAGRALIAAATTLAIATAGVPAANAAPVMTSSEREECIDTYVKYLREEGTNPFWDPEIDKELTELLKGTNIDAMGVCSKLAQERSDDFKDENDWRALKRDGYAAVLAVYRAPLVATIVVPILALLGAGAWAVQQGLIPGL